MQTVLKTSSISRTTKEIRINHDKTTTYIDHYEHGELVAHFTMLRADWDIMVATDAATGTWP